MTDDLDKGPIQRLIALTLFVVLCALVAAVFVTGFRERAEAGAMIAVVESQIAAFDERLVRLKSETTNVPADGVDAAWIAADTRAVAAATIQKIVGEIVASAGGTVREVQIPDPAVEDELADSPSPVAAVFLFETTHAGLRDILVGIEAARPMLQTDKLTIQSLSRPEDEYGETPLRAELHITGYWMGAER